MVLSVMLDRLSEAKRDILRESPDDWFLVDEFGWHNNQKLGVHLQQMFQRGLFERKCEISGLQRASYRLTDRGRDSRAMLKAKIG